MKIWKLVSIADGQEFVAGVMLGSSRRVLELLTTSPGFSAAYLDQLRFYLGVPSDILTAAADPTNWHCLKEYFDHANAFMDFMIEHGSKGVRIEQKGETGAGARV